MTKTGLRYFFVLSIATLGCMLGANAQVGQIDTSFYKHMGISGIVNSGVEMGDSGIVIGGSFLSVNRTPVNRIVKLKQNGEVDSAFNVGTGANNNVAKIVKQPDGRLLVGGAFSQYNGATANRLMRLAANGARDASFTPTFNGQISDMLLQPDSFIVVVGTFTGVNGSTINRITRLKYNGTRDSTFVIGSGPNANIYSISRQSNGKYIIAGDFTSFNGLTANRIARLNINGSLDTTFNIGSGPNGGVQTIRVLSNDKILFSGPFFATFNGVVVNRFACLYPNGVLDTTFNSGTGMNASAIEIVQESNGRIIVVGGFASYNGTSIARIMRLDSTGRIDTSFHVGSGLTNTCNTVFIGASNRYYLGGGFVAYNNYARFSMARVENNGDLDQGFMHDTRFNGQINAVGFQSDGKIIVGGSFTRYSDRNIRCIARLNIDGNLDTTFNYGNAGPNTEVTVLAVRGDDKIYIGGSFSTYNGATANDVALLDADGTLNTSFTTNTGVGCCGISEIVPLPSGKLYIAGGYDRYRNMLGTSRITRLKANGDRDSSFVSPISNGFVFRVMPMDGGKIIIGGTFSQINGVAHNSIAMLDSTGKIDSTYRNGQGFESNGSRFVMEQQTDGKMIIGFENSRVLDGVTRSRIARLTKDGWIDTTYDPNNQAIVTGGGSWSTAFKYMYNGTYVAYSGGSKFLDNNGIINTTDFYPGSIVGGLSLRKDDLNGRLIMVGEFYDALSFSCNRVIAFRNYMDNTNISGPVCRGGTTMVCFDKRLTFNSSNIFAVQLSDSLGSFASPVAIGADTVGGWGPDSVRVSIPMYKGNGTGYRVRVISTDPAFTGASSNPFTIGPLPPPTIIGDTMFCAGDTVTLSAGSADTYSWSTGPTAQVLHVANGGTYSLTITDNNCTASASKTVTEILPDSLSVVLPYTLLGRNDTCYTFSLDSFGISTDSLEWSLRSNFDTAYIIGADESILLCINVGAIDTVWFRPYVSGPGCRGNASYIVLRTLAYPIEVVKLSDIGTMQEVHASDKLKFIVLGYTYAQQDSVEFYYRIMDEDGTTVSATASVGYSLDGHYEIGALSSLTVGEKYRLDLILYNGNRYSFVLVRD